MLSKGQSLLSNFFGNTQPNGAQRSAETVITYSQRTYLIHSNQLSVSPSQSQRTFNGGNGAIFRITHENVPYYLQCRCIWKQQAWLFGNSRRGYMETVYMSKSRYAAISYHSSQISFSIFLKSKTVFTSNAQSEATLTEW